MFNIVVMEKEKIQNTARLEVPDLLRGLAVILMIQVHLTELFLRPDLFNGSFGKLSLFLGAVPAAPVFMVLMGYFLAMGNKPAKQIITRGVKLFFGGLILNIGLNANLLIKIYAGKIQLNPWNYIFGVDILLFAGLAMIVIGLMQYISLKSVAIYLIIAAISAGGSTYIAHIHRQPSSIAYAVAFIGGNSAWSYFPLLPWLAYPLSGFALKRLTDTVIVPRLIFILAVVLFLVGLPYGWKTSTQLDLYYHHSIVFVIWTFAFIVLLVKGAEVWNQYGNQPVLHYIRWIGQHVTAMYVFQWLMIGNIATSIYKTLSWTAWLFWFIGITLVSSILTYFFVTFKRNFQN